MSTLVIRRPKWRPIAISLLILAIGGGMMLAIIRGLVANGTLLIRVGTVELPSTGAAHFEMVIIEGASHLVVTGHDPGSNAYRGLAQMTQRGPYCHVEVDRILHSVRQYSGDYIHAFRASEPCTTVTFGKRRVAVAPGQRPPSRSPALLSEG